MGKEYSQVEISDEMKEMLDNPFDDLNLETPETTESQETEKSEADDTSATETTTEETSHEVTEPVVEDRSYIEINGQKYDKETVLKFKEDSDNKSSWQKSNTEKAQNLSKWGKLTDKINNDEEFRGHLKDYFFDDPEAIKALGLDGEINIPVSEKEVKEVIADDKTEIRLRALETVERGRLMESRVDKLDRDLTRIEKANPEILKGEKGAQFLEFAEKNAHKFQENGMPNLDRAFKEWSYDELQNQLNHYKKLEQNSKKNTGVINKSEGGAKEVKSPNKIKAWRDVSMDNPDIAKHFDN
jgi:hypothetical protein